MADFVLTYRAPEDYTFGTADGITAWSYWFESMGEQLVDIGRPVAESSRVGDCGRDVRRLGGFSIIEAEDLEAAVAVAKGCPFVGSGGGVEVGMLADLPTAKEAS
jgi:YCII-related domain